MASQYVVQYGRWQETEPVTTFAEALALAKELGGFSIVNYGEVDVCEDSDCNDCNRDGLTPDERAQVDDAGIG